MGQLREGLAELNNSTLWGYVELYMSKSNNSLLLSNKLAILVFTSAMFPKMYLPAYSSGQEFCFYCILDFYDILTLYIVCFSNCMLFWTSMAHETS